MEHSTHFALMLAAAVFVTAGGLIVLALAWRRSFRGERSGVVIGDLSARQSIGSLVAVPAAGLLGLVILGLLAPLLR